MLTSIIFDENGPYIQCHSDLCYEGNLATAREFLLYLFNKRKNVRRKEFVQATGQQEEAVKHLLSEMAVLKKKKNRTERVWKLSLPPDTEFLEKYPDVVERHAHHWAEETGMCVY